jgi:hypothetical protein
MLTKLKNKFKKLKMPAWKSDNLTNKMLDLNKNNQIKNNKNNLKKKIKKIKIND